jgi:hypothetical protein
VWIIDAPHHSYRDKPFSSFSAPPYVALGAHRYRT